MQLRSKATYASMSSNNIANNQDAATILLVEILITQQSHQDVIVQLSSKLDEIMKLLEKSQEKHQLKIRLQTINLDNCQVDHVKTKTIL